MPPINSIKIAIPALLGLAVAGGVVGYWYEQLLQYSFHTDGSYLSQYAAKVPAVKNPSPAEVGYCDPANKTRWAVCNLAKP